MAHGDGRNPLGDDPLAVAADHEIEWRQAQEVIGQIEAMLDSDSYQFAEETLTGIKETIERWGRVTEAQRQAVDNIEQSKIRINPRRRYRP